MLVGDSGRRGHLHCSAALRRVETRPISPHNPQPPASFIATRINGLRYYSPTGIPSHTAHRIEGRGKKGEQGSQRRLAHSAPSDVAFTGASRESSGSGTLGVAVLGQGRSTQFSRPAPSHLAWSPRLSSIHRSQPLCSSEHPPKTPGPIGLSPPRNGRSGLVHPGTDDRQAAPSAEYYYTPRSHTYEQISPERHEYAFHFGRDQR